MPSLRKRPAPPEDVAPPKVDSPKPAVAKSKAEVPPLLQRIRNMWQFANLFQFIVLFGKVVKLDDSIDIEDLEHECLKHNSTVLSDIGLALLKFVSSHKGITPEIFDEQARRQFQNKLPDRNPFGTEESPVDFAQFDIFTKIRVLQQLTQWAMIHPERIREKMDEHDHTNWRIEPYGWDSHDRTYFVLDDNRIYRLSEAAAPLKAAPPKKNTKKWRSEMRAKKRRRISSSPEDEDHEDHEDPHGEAEEPEQQVQPEDDCLGTQKWECLAVTLADVRELLSTIQKSRDPNEKVLRTQLEEHLIPILERQEESQRRKAIQREKELLSLDKLAHAKRSSRIASKAEQQRHDEQAREEEQKRRAEALAAKKEESKRMKLERERDIRLMGRERRLKEREAKRLRYEEELAQLSEDAKLLDAENGRISERRLKASMEKSKQALEELEEDEEDKDWTFDCICGVYGQIDDGTHSISCERCNVWQHSKCVGVSEEEADSEAFHFVCSTCRRKEDAAREKPTPRIKLKFTRPGSSSSAVEVPQGTLTPSNVVIPVTVANPSSSPSLPPLGVFSVAARTTGIIREASTSSTKAEQSGPSSPTKSRPVGVPISPGQRPLLPVPPQDSSKIAPDRSSGPQIDDPVGVHRAVNGNGLAFAHKPDFKPPESVRSGPVLPVKHAVSTVRPSLAANGAVEQNGTPAARINPAQTPKILPQTGMPPSSQSNPFSSPHPTLSPPQQSPTKAKAYGSILDPPSSPPAQLNGNGVKQGHGQGAEAVVGVDPSTAQKAVSKTAAHAANGHVSTSPKLQEDAPPSGATSTPASPVKQQVQLLQTAASLHSPVNHSEQVNGTGS